MFHFRRIDQRPTVSSPIMQTKKNSRNYSSLKKKKKRRSRSGRSTVSLHSFREEEVSNAEEILETASVLDASSLNSICNLIDETEETRFETPQRIIFRRESSAQQQKEEQPKSVTSIQNKKNHYLTENNKKKERDTVGSNNKANINLAFDEATKVLEPAVKEVEKLYSISPPSSSLNKKIRTAQQQSQPQPQPQKTNLDCDDDDDDMLSKELLQLDNVQQSLRKELQSLQRYNTDTFLNDHDNLLDELGLETSSSPPLTQTNSKTKNNTERSNQQSWSFLNDDCTITTTTETTPAFAKPNQATLLRHEELRRINKQRQAERNARSKERPTFIVSSPNSWQNSPTRIINCDGHSATRASHDERRLASDNLLPSNKIAPTSAGVTTPPHSSSSPADLSLSVYDRLYRTQTVSSSRSVQNKLTLHNNNEIRKQQGGHHNHQSQYQQKKTGSTYGSTVVANISDATVSNKTLKKKSLPRPKRRITDDFSCPGQGAFSTTTKITQKRQKKEEQCFETPKSSFLTKFICFGWVVFLKVPTTILCTILFILMFHLLLSILWLLMAKDDDDDGTTVGGTRIYYSSLNNYPQYGIF